MVEGKSKLSVVKKQAPWGIYVWVTPEGGVLINSNGDLLNIPARQYDIEAISKITAAAKYYGHEEGFAEYWPGVQRITDEEHSVQLDRMKQGLIASETDIGAWMDAAKGARANGGE